MSKNIAAKDSTVSITASNSDAPMTNAPIMPAAPIASDDDDAFLASLRGEFVAVSAGKKSSTKTATGEKAGKYDAVHAKIVSKLTATGKMVVLTPQDFGKEDNAKWRESFRGTAQDYMLRDYDYDFPVVAISNALTAVKNKIGTSILLCRVPDGLTGGLGDNAKSAKEWAAAFAAGDMATCDAIVAKIAPTATA